MLRNFHPQFLTAYFWLAQFCEKLADALKDSFQINATIRPEINQGAVQCLQMFHQVTSILGIKVQTQKIQQVLRVVDSKNRPGGASYKGQEARWVLQEIHTIMLDFNRELEGWAMFAVPPQRAQFLTNARTLHPFGESVSRAFPESQNELIDAHRCLALECYTACVMHLMRALEGPVRALARIANVPDTVSWGPLLEKVQANVRSSIKSAEDARKEHWKLEVCQHLLLVKDAWRNEAAHGLHRYSASEAETILVSVRTLMQTAARNLAPAE